MCIFTAKLCSQITKKVHVFCIGYYGHIVLVTMVIGEVAKLQNHLRLLREEYVKLQNKYADLERKYQVAVAGSGGGAQDTFVSRLLKLVADLFDKDQYR